MFRIGGGRRGRLSLLVAGASALVAVAVATAAGSAVPVTLKLVGSADRDVGQAARVTATATLPAGAHLLIQRYAPKHAPAKVIECLRSPCTGIVRDSKPEVVGFQAFAIKRDGKKTTILGRSKRLSVSWTVPTAAEPPAPPETSPPPPPPPAPAATPGHFAGTIGNAASPIQFDIGADGLSMVNWVTGEIDESCDPPTYTFWFTSLSGPGPYPVASDGTFANTFSGSTPNIDYVIKFSGKVTGASASGNLRVDSSYLLSDGNRLNCSSSDQPWTATRTG